MDPDSPRLRVSVTDGRGRPVRAPGLARWLAGVAPGRARGEVTIALVTDGQIQQLNRRFRHKDAPTDVLSFPGAEHRASSAQRRAPSAQRRAPITQRRAPSTQRRAPSGQRPAPSAQPHLGDIAIAMGVARRQARDAGHSFDVELRVLALHGLLHLLGYDHHDRTDRGRMARVERRLRRQGSLNAGLIERARSSDRPGRGTRRRFEP